MLNSYFTVGQLATAEIIEKKSRFIANIANVRTEEEAQGFLESIRKQYKDAGHNVYAYKVGLTNEIVRCSDDGEPSGTAGKPVLEVIQGNNLRNVIVVVTRYFGGTLLGSGGLVRAYSGAAKEGLLEAEVIERTLRRKWTVTVGYDLSKKFQHEFKKSNYILSDTVYEQDIAFCVLVNANECDYFEAEMQNLGNGGALVEADEWVYV
ncbi:MAG: YigZ family protein [Defluviitaleaceae bacterium]|nr:YigZ family protein [Defluviitaleaceae bacterium]